MGQVIADEQAKKAAEEARYLAQGGVRLSKATLAKQEREAKIKVGFRFCLLWRDVFFPFVALTVPHQLLQGSQSNNATIEKKALVGDGGVAWRLKVRDFAFWSMCQPHSEQRRRHAVLMN